MPSDTDALRKLRAGDPSGMNDLLASYRQAAYNYLLLVQRRDHRLLEKFQAFFLGIPAMAQKRQVRADFAAWYYRALMAAGEAYQTYVDEESLPVQKKLGELSLPLRQVVFFRHELNLSWDLLARVFRQSEERVRLAFQEALVALVPLLRGRNFPEEICRNLNGHLVAFLYHEMEAAQKDAYQRHLASCAWCRARIRGVQNLFIEMEALSLEEPPALAIQNILAETARRVKRSEKISRRYYYGTAAVVVLLAAGILSYRSAPKGKIPPPTALPMPGSLQKSSLEISRPVGDEGRQAPAERADVPDRRPSGPPGKIRGNFGKILVAPILPDDEKNAFEDCELPAAGSLALIKGIKADKILTPDQKQKNRGSDPDKMPSSQEEAAAAPADGEASQALVVGSNGRYWVAVGQPGDIMDPQGRVMAAALETQTPEPPGSRGGSWFLGEDSPVGFPNGLGGDVVMGDLAGGLGEESQDITRADPMGGLLPLPAGLAGSGEAWYPQTTFYETPHLPRPSRDNACRSESP